MNRVRPPAVAGSFYPSDAGQLNELLDECFNTSPLGPKGTRSPSTTLIAGLVPHAGYFYSGPCAAHLYAALDKSVQRVILLGVNHQARGQRAALSPWENWQTPLGLVPVDEQFQEIIASRVTFMKSDAQAHGDEHSIEVQLPFLQRVLQEFTFLPISLAWLDLKECAQIGMAIAEACRTQFVSGVKTVILASSDLSHYLSPHRTNELDQAALEKIVSLDPGRLLSVVQEKEISMCGVLPTAVMLYAATALGATRARLLQHCHSGDAIPMRNVVGYASVVIEP
jgi:MEMO1 family protein